LWYALSESIRYSALATAGIFIALAALTRPLMTVFAAPAALLIFLFAKGSFSVRVFQVIVFIIAIALPIVAVGCTILSQNRQCVGLARGMMPASFMPQAIQMFKFGMGQCTPLSSGRPKNGLAFQTLRRLRSMMNSGVRPWQTT
jgi:4-amino-4-deoxy-L-arabinose transferase-like glycosyltransferase